FKFEVTNRSVSFTGGVGGYWNDDDECSENRKRRDGGPELLPGEAMAAGAGAGCACGRAVRVCGQLDEDLLQTELCEPAAFAQAGELLPYPGAGRSGWIPGLQTMRAGADGCEG